MPDVNVNLSSPADYKYVYDIAYIKAVCDYNQKYNRCERNCTLCSYNGYLNIVSQLPVHINAAIVRLSNEQMASFLQKKKEAVKYKWERRALYVIIVIICIAIAVCIAMLLKSVSINDANLVVDDERIVTVLTETQRKMYDVNDDSCIDCKDYAILYKLVWDGYYPANDCIVMYTILKYIPTGKEQAHLYVAVRNNDIWINIEPQGTVTMYELSRYWHVKNWKVLSFYSRCVGEDVWRSIIKKSLQ